MIKNYKLLLLLLFICCAGNSLAQYGASNYIFSENTAGTYTAITGTATGAFGDDGCDNSLPIGFTFNYAGTAYTDFSVSTNGFIKFGSSITCNNNHWTNYLGNPNNNWTPMIAGFWDDNSIPNGTGSIQYLTQGTPGNQTLTVQWTNMVFSTGGTTPYMDFQIILYETSDIIEIVYGGTSQASVSRSAAIGIESTQGDFMSVTPNTSGATYNTLTPNNNVTISSTSALPSGLTYTFTPPPPCSGAPVAGSAVASSQALCPNQAFTLYLSGGTIATGLTFDWQYDDGSGWQSTGGTNGNYSSTFTFFGPVDFRCIVDCGGLQDISAPVTLTPGSFFNCYCSPNNGTTLSQYGAYDNFITGVEVPTTTLNNPTTSYNSNGYQQFIPPAPNQTDTFFPGITYTVNVDMVYPQWDYAGVWIDWDMDGTFDNSSGSVEWVAMTPTSNGATGTFTVPLSAVAGATGMRVRVNDYGYQYGPTGTGPCSNDGSGETEDYMIFIGVLNPCSGTPNPATITGPSGICPSMDFTLVANGMSIGLNLTYDWQYNDGSGWQTTGGAATTYTQAGGITVPTDYRLITYCAGSNQYDTSNVLSVAVNDFFACYCSPLNGTVLYQYGSYNYLTNVEILSTTLSYSNSTYNNNGYEQFIPPAANQTDTFFPGITYTINVDLMYPQWQYAGVWIDWDMDGTFDNSSGSAEWVAMTPTSNGATGTFTVPLSAVAGATGMRVRMNDYGYPYGPSGHGPCQDSYYGETEDYMIFIGALYPCAGTPNPAVISGPSGICPSLDFTLVASGMSIGLGITYDWQYNDGSGWQTTGGAATTYTESAGITVPTDYRLITYCANSNQYDTSNVLSVAVNDFFACYCSPLNGTTLYQYGSYNYLTNVEIPTTTLSNPNTTYNNNGYEQFIPPAANQTDTFFPGLTYTINVDLMYPQWQYAGVWIDWDMDGTFDNSSGSAEWITMTPTSNGATGTFTVPSSAVAGATGLRVRMNDGYGPYGPSGYGPCQDSYYGETEDYMIFIGALYPCAGTPNPATISGPSSACPSLDFTLVATGMSIGLGITYDWQYDDGSGWQTTGSSGTTHTQAGGITVPTDYRLITYCANSNQYDTSNVHSVAVNDFYACYCSPLNGTVLYQYGSYNYLTNVEIPNTTLSNPNSTYNNNGYEQFIPPAANQTASLLAGVTYTINVGVMYPQWQSQYTGVWIDWDMDGTFDNSSGSTEWIAMTAGSNGATGTFTVPAGAPQGLTGLRVRMNDYSYAYGPSGHSPCQDSYYGETEDYIITILPPPSCIPPSGLNATGVTATTATLNWTQNSTAPQWEIEYGPAPFTPGTGAGTGVITSTFPYPLTGLNPVTNYQFYVRDICGANDTSLWSMGSFTTACAAITTFPWTYDVETQPGNQGSGQFTGCWTASPVPSSSIYEWNVSTNGGTPSSGTGPSSAHSGSRFFYTEASYGPWNNATATLTSPQFDITGLATPTLEFYYHMYGADINKLVIEINSGSTWDRVDSLVGQQQTSNGAAWLLRTIPLSAYTGVIEIRFEATEGTGFQGDLAIDDIVITSTPTAIKLDKLSAVNVGASNRVEWNTFGEERSDKFELERSADGKHFAKIYERQANGAPSRYTYMDNTPVKGMNYYRLRMTEANGKAVYSEVVKAFVSSTGFEVDAFPNPVSHDLTVQVSGVQGADASVQVTDVTGKLIKTVKMTSNVETIDMSGLANGIYLIKYSDANHTQTIRVNKQ